MAIIRYVKRVFNGWLRAVIHHYVTKTKGKSMRILLINPGATSTKIAVFEDENEVFKVALVHTAAELEPYVSVIDQLEFRKQLVLDTLSAAGIEVSGFDAICGRGGLLRPVCSGTYRINERVLEDMRSARYGEHASNLGCCLAWELSKPAGIPAFFVDPPSTDERGKYAKVSGYKGMERTGIFHALNQKGMARIAAEKIGRAYEECNLIVVHMGGGTSVAAHQKGRTVDVTNCQEEGSFSIDRCGSLPITKVLSMCYSGIPYQKLKRGILRDGGLYSYLGTRDFREIEQRVQEGDEETGLLVGAMAYQTAKDIGAMAAVLHFDVDAIVFTGGLANSKWLCEEIGKYVEKIAPILILPGEDEMRRMALGVLRVFQGGEALEY